jgi:PTH1 family peptidyl-tRNA hydrolase
MKCIIGLGNPGRKYRETRHNIGFLAIDELAKRAGESLTQHKFTSDFASVIIGGEKVLLVKPQTFMNLSGEGVRPLLDYFNIETRDIAVIYDDLDLPTGKIRLREKGGHGGHNGIKSLITHLGTKEFKRIRIGIGRPTNQMMIVDYVLQRFQKEEMSIVADSIRLAADASEIFIGRTFHDAMNACNLNK